MTDEQRDRREQGERNPMAGWAPEPEPSGMTYKLSVPVALSLMLSLPVSIRAHHAFDAEFDRNRPITLQGTVTRLDWVNPHAWIYIEVRTKDGTTTKWRIQAASPSVLALGGWRKDSVLPGVDVVVQGFRARSQLRVVHGRDVLTADGRRMCANIPC